MNRSMQIFALLAALGLSACDRPAVVTVPDDDPVAVPGPPGPPGPPGKPGENTTVVVPPHEDKDTTVIVPVPEPPPPPPPPAN